MALTRKHSIFVTFFLPILYALVLYLTSRQSIGAISLSFLIFGPFFTGLLTVLLDQDNTENQSIHIYIPYILFQFGFLSLVLVFINYETLICVGMALPIAYVIGLIGAIFGKFIKILFNSRKLYSLTILPLLMMPIEQKFSVPDDINTINSEIIISASPEIIWEEIIAMQNISEAEIPWSIMHNILRAPKPLFASLDKQEIGGIRSVKWTKKVYFDEIITTWQPPQKLHYKWKFYEDSFPHGSIDNYIEIGGRYVDILEGGYELKQIENGLTQVILSTKYRSTTPFNWYTRWLASWMLDDFHMAVLTVAKNRLEDRY